MLGVADGLLLDSALGAKEGISVSTILGLSLGCFREEECSKMIFESATVNIETQDERTPTNLLNWTQ